MPDAECDSEKDSLAVCDCEGEIDGEEDHVTVELALSVPLLERVGVTVTLWLALCEAVLDTVPLPLAVSEGLELNVRVRLTVGDIDQVEDKVWLADSLSDRDAEGDDVTVAVMLGLRVWDVVNDELIVADAVGLWEIECVVD